MIVIVWLFFVAAFSFIPFKTRVPHADKLVHFILYAITGLLFFTYLIKKTSFKNALALSIILPVAYGVIIEVAQRYTGRTPSFADALANAAGAAAAGLFIGMKRKWR